MSPFRKMLLLVVRGLATALNFAVGLALSNFVSVSAFNAFGYLHSSLNFSSMMGMLGFNTLALKKAAETEDRKSGVGLLFSLILISGLLTLLAALIVSTFINDKFSSVGYLFFLMFPLAVACFTATRIISDWNKGKERQFVAVFLESRVWLLLFLPLVVLFREQMKQNVGLMLHSYFVAMILASVVSFFSIRRIGPKRTDLSLSEAVGAGKRLMSLSKLSWQYYVLQLCNVAQDYLLIFYAERYLEPFELTALLIATRFGGVMVTVSGVLVNIYAPKFVKMYDSGNGVDLVRLFRESKSINATLLILMLACFVVFDEFILSLFHDGLIDPKYSVVFLLTLIPYALRIPFGLQEYYLSMTQGSGLDAIVFASVLVISVTLLLHMDKSIVNLIGVISSGVLIRSITNSVFTVRKINNCLKS